MHLTRWPVSIFLVIRSPHSRACDPLRELSHSSDEAYKANTLHCTYHHHCRKAGGQRDTERAPFIPPLPVTSRRTLAIPNQQCLSMLQGRCFSRSRRHFRASRPAGLDFLMHAFNLLRVEVHRWAALDLVVSRTSSTSDRVSRPLNATWRQYIILIQSI